ncbi:MAG: helix-turn-helix domain-containing protein [Actinomycetota bacterium]
MKERRSKKKGKGCEIDERFKLRHRKNALEDLQREQVSPQVRRRAHCILLRFRGFDTEKLISIFGVSRRTLQYRDRKWEEEKLVGLYDQTGRGRKAKLKKEQREQVRK